MDHQQNIESHWDGSWDPIGRWGYEGGRVYATAINVLTLKADALFPLFAAGSPLPRPATFAPDPLTEEQKRVVRDVVDGARTKARGADRDINVTLPGSKSPAKRIAALDTAPRGEAMQILKHLAEHHPQAAIRTEARAIIDDVTRHLKKRRRAESIRANVRALGSGHPDVQDRAARKLLDFGDEAIEPLREAAAGPVDDPARPRVMAVLTRLANTTPDQEEMIATLNRTKIDVNLDKRPLKEVVDILHEATGLSFHIDKDVEAEKISISMQIQGLSALWILKLALGQSSLGYAYDKNGIRICELSELR
jgi:hypothetical protein